MKLKTIQALSIVVIIGLALLSGVLAYQYQNLKTGYEKLSSDFDALSKEHLSLQISYSNLQGNYSTLSQNYTSLKETYHQALSRISSLESQVSSLQSQLFSVQNQLQALQTQYNALQAQYNALQAQYTVVQNNLNTIRGISIGTILETYYDYVRANYLTFGLTPVSEERWDLYPNYYSTSVTFAAGLASHDIGNCYWSSLESGCNYYSYTGEYSYQTSSRIMQKVMTLTGISSSDSIITKIDKVLAFISSNVHYESRLLDHMWFPCETLTFHSGDCTSFSILAASMLEEVGIKSAVGFFYNSTLGGHAMVLVHLNDLGLHGYRYYSDLTGYKLASGRWIIIEPQFSSLTQQDSSLNSIGYWSLKACAEVPYGP